MPNLCNGFMNVRGYRDNVDEFVKICQAKYNYRPDRYAGEWNADPKNFSHIPHFFRVFQAYVENENMYGLCKSITIGFEVAWSVWSCMFDGEHTYYRDTELAHPGNHHASHILKESKRLDLEIEIWSYEYGMQFQEHYLIRSGELVTNEVFNFTTVYTPEVNYNEFQDKYAKDLRYSISEQEYTEMQKCDEFIDVGYHDEECLFLPEDGPDLSNLKPMIIYTE